MNILKATFFKNCGHKIEPMECIKLTFDAVVFSRSIDSMQRTHSNSNIVFQRESNNERYCADMNEAKDFLDTKYQDSIEEHQGYIFKLKQKQKKLLEI